MAPTNNSNTTASEILYPPNRNIFGNQIKTLIENLAYTNREDTIKHITQALHKYDNLGVTSDTYTDRSVKFRPINLIKLTGTFPITYKNSEYHVPIEIFLPTIFPTWPPVCFVRPTEEMAFVDSHANCRSTDGKICTRFITAWAKKRGKSCSLNGGVQTSSDGYCLIKLLDDFVNIFSGKPPVKNRPSVECPPSYEEVMGSHSSNNNSDESDKENQPRTRDSRCNCRKDEETTEIEEELPSYEESNRLEFSDRMNSCRIK